MKIWNKIEKKKGYMQQQNKKRFENFRKL